MMAQRVGVGSTDTPEGTHPLDFASAECGDGWPRFSPGSAGHSRGPGCTRLEETEHAPNGR